MVRFGSAGVYSWRRRGTRWGAGDQNHFRHGKVNTLPAVLLLGLSGVTLYFVFTHVLAGDCSLG